MKKKLFLNKFYRAKEEVNKDNSSFISRLKAVVAGDEYLDDDFDELDYVSEDELDDEKNVIDFKAKKPSKSEKAAVTKKNEYKKVLSEFENLKKRVSKDKDDLKIELTSKALDTFLPVLDNFERSIRSIEPKSEEAQNIYRSYISLYKQLAGCFVKEGVEPMNVLGKKFNPNLHEAVFYETSENYEEGLISEELQRGFFKDGKVLRYAKVKVSKGISKHETISSTDKNTD